MLGLRRCKWVEGNIGLHFLQADKKWMAEEQVEVVVQHFQLFEVREHHLESRYFDCFGRFFRRSCHLESPLFSHLPQFLTSSEAFIFFSRSLVF